MSHNHSHHHDHTQGEKNIKTAFFLNFIFTILEVAGAYGQTAWPFFPTLYMI